MFTIALARKDPLGLWVLKWIIAPLLVLAFLIAYVHQSRQLSRAAQVCREQGYAYSSYAFPSRTQTQEWCSCWGKIQPDGTIVDTKKVRIPLE